MPSGLQLLQVPANMPLGLAGVLAGLPLRDQAFPYLLQCDQPVAVLLCHGMYSSVYVSRLTPSFGADTATADLVPLTIKPLCLSAIAVGIGLRMHDS